MLVGGWVLVAHVMQRFLAVPCHTTLLVVGLTCMLGHERFHSLFFFCIICIRSSCFQLIFSHCPVQYGKKSLETRFFVVLVCSSCSRCLVPIPADYSFRRPFFSVPPSGPMPTMRLTMHTRGLHPIAAARAWHMNKEEGMNIRDVIHCLCQCNLFEFIIIANS